MILPSNSTKTMTKPNPTCFSELELLSAIGICNAHQCHWRPCDSPDRQSTAISICGSRIICNPIDPPAPMPGFRCHLRGDMPGRLKQSRFCQAFFRFGEVPHYNTTGALIKSADCNACQLGAGKDFVFTAWKRNERSGLPWRMYTPVAQE